MKKFHFSLEKILSYTNQVLENQQNELQIILNRLDAIETQLKELDKEYTQTNKRLLETYQAEITAKEVISFKNYLSEIDKKMRVTEEKKQSVKSLLQKKQETIKKTKIEIATYEKLKEKQFAQYNIEERKEQEVFIEEFVNHSSINSS